MFRKYNIHVLLLLRYRQLLHLTLNRLHEKTVHFLTFLYYHHDINYMYNDYNIIIYNIYEIINDNDLIFINDMLNTKNHKVKSH